MMEEFYYGEHANNRIALYQPPPKRNAPRPENAVWLIYIHGGAWRDPSIDEYSFESTAKSLLRSRWIDQIKGFASISYRLSCHPKFRQDSTTPVRELRRAKHPEHLEDILAAIVFLQENFRVGHRYILAGHSCGATLAFQTIMGLVDSPKFIKPRAIIGAAGIYNLRGLRDRNADPYYQDFISGAFGDNEDLWDAVSPINIKLSENPWPEGRVVIIASSTQDKAVEAAQMDEMEKTLKSFKGIRVHTWRRILHCSHDEIWQDDGLAEILEKGLDIYYNK